MLLSYKRKCMCSHLIGIRTNHLIKWRGHSMYGLNNICFQCRDIVKSDLNLFHILYVINTLKDWMAILPKNCTRKNFTHTLSKGIEDLKNQQIRNCFIQIHVHLPYNVHNQTTWVN